MIKWVSLRTCLFVLSASFSLADTHRGAQFIGFTNFHSFKIETASGRTVLTSEEIRPEINWNELVPSWNYRGAKTNGLVIEARTSYPDHTTKWYHLGNWALDPAGFPRRSIRNQNDVDGDVSTDTLQMKRPGGALQLRVTLHGRHEVGTLTFLGLSFCDTTRLDTGEMSPNAGAWGKSLPVPERSQANYPEGIASWCSPTAVSMILSYWSAILNRPEIGFDVPEIARFVEDPNWPGTGNWPFNTAFAGSQSGMRAYVARFSDVRELEDWIQSGIPVAVSVSNGWLKGDPEPGNGHLVVCIGFTEKGDPIINDPGRRAVRQIYTRENLRRAWKKSYNTVYLIYPERATAPADQFGHWFNH
jgi:hypothetical protein